MFVSNAKDHTQMDGTMSITAAVAQPLTDQIHTPIGYEFTQEIGNCGCHMRWVGTTSGKTPDTPGESVKFVPAQQSQNLNQDLIKLTIPTAADIDSVATELKISVLCLGSER